jgi:ABC-type Fe3+-hydroxamate transport system substrate-binding protein
LTRFRLEAFWLLPFVFLAAASLALLRPLPELSPSFSGETRTIVDAQGNEVDVLKIPQKVLSAYPRSYLPKTHAPELLTQIGDKWSRKGFADTPLGWIYPRFLEERYWWSGGSVNLETLLARDEPGALYFGNIWIGGDVYDSASLRRHFGLTAIATMPREARDALLEKLGISGDEYRMFADVRVLNAALDQTAFGEAIIARYRRGMAEVAGELRPETIPEAERPRVLGMGAPPDDWLNIYIYMYDDNPFLATRGAARGLRATGRQQEAERILAMNPDIIMSNPEDMYRDPRWRGLDAVFRHRVYDRNPMFSGYVHDIDNLPLSACWQAEIFHPKRMSARTREKIRAHYRKSYGFEMDDTRIDTLLRVEENAASVGYERFFARKEP